MQRVILHIDMNSYFASVEQQANPFLRGKPVGVCAYLSKNGCVLASSMEAKEKGIKTGCRVREARDLYPNTIFLQNDPAKYRSTTEKIFSILAEYTDKIEPYSIDEAFLDLTGYVRNLAEGYLLGQEISRRIRQEVGEWLRSSVGISETRFIAKLLSDTGPKDAVTAVPTRELAGHLKNIELTDIWGIGRGVKRRLAAIGIHTPLALLRSSPMRILASLKKPGYYLWAQLNGFELNDGVIEEHQPKSVGHSYCLAEKTKDPGKLARILMKLSEKTGRRLRASELEAKSVSLGYRLERSGVELQNIKSVSKKNQARGEHPVRKDHKLIDKTGDPSRTGGGYISVSYRLPIPIFDSLEIFREGWRLLEADKLTDRVTMLAISVSSLTVPTNQQSLFHDVRKDRKSVARALDTLNDKWGEYTVTRGAMWQTHSSAPDRIGFRKTLAIPEFEEKIYSEQIK